MSTHSKNSSWILSNISELHECITDHVLAETYINLEDSESIFCEEENYWSTQISFQAASCRGLFENICERLFALPSFVARVSTQPR